MVKVGTYLLLLWVPVIQFKLRLDKTRYLNLKSGLEGRLPDRPRSYQNVDQTEKGIAKIPYMANLPSFLKGFLYLQLKLHKFMIDLVQPFFSDSVYFTG